MAELLLCRSPVKRAFVTFHLCADVGICMRDSAGAGRFPWLVSPGTDALSARILVIPLSQVKLYFYNNGRNGRKLDVQRANTDLFVRFRRPFGAFLMAVSGRNIYSEFYPACMRWFPNSLRNYSELWLGEV